MIGFNGGLVGKTRLPTALLSVPGAWTLREQMEAKRSNKWPSTLFLDAFTGAASAYSLRLLRQDFSSSAIVEVRRSSDSTTQTFTATQVLDGTLTSFCGTGDGFVRTWYDQSGNANNALASTSTRQPQIVSGGQLITNNGLPVLRFNGSTNYFTQTVNTTISQPFTAIVVAKRNSTTGINQDYYRSSQNEGVHFHNSGDAYNLYAFAGTVQKLGDTAIGTRFISALAYNGTSSSSSFNGSQVTTNLGTAGLTISNALNIGANNIPGSYLSADMPELIFYASSQASNFAAMSLNTNAYYGIY